MDKIKRYIDCGIETQTCNLRCHYCYIAQRGLFNKAVVTFSHSKEEIRKALSKQRFGGICLFNFCAAGETLLSSDVLPVVHELLEEGHYVMIVTNGTLTKRFEEISAWSKEYKDHLFIKFSFHFLEFKRLGWMNRFFENVRLMKESGVSFTVEVTPSDELIPYIDEIKAVCMEKLGALCHVTIARDERTKGFEILTDLSRDEYCNVWGAFESELFYFKNSIFGVKRNEFCYAGEWTFFLSLESGELKQCVYEKTIDNIFTNIDKPLHFEVVGHNCSMPHCWNGHSYLGLGAIPEFVTPTYAEMRNRVCSDGSEWLRPSMKSFMSTKLNESNPVYNWLEKITLKRPMKTIVKETIKHSSLYSKARKMKEKLRRK